jgi:hypothetical protein
MSHGTLWLQESGPSFSNLPDLKAARDGMKSHSFITEVPWTKADPELEPDGSDAVSRWQIPSKKARGPDPKPKGFVCPFWKFDQLKHIRCGSKILPNIRHVKEHLVRVHRRPEFYCQRCHGVFESHKHLESHSLEICKTETASQNDFLTADQLSYLQRRSSRLVTLEQQWFYIYDILFPGLPHPRSPYNDGGREEAVSSYLAFVCSHRPLLQDVLPTLHVSRQNTLSMLTRRLEQISTLWLRGFDERPGNGDFGESEMRRSTLSGWSGTTLAAADAPSPLEQSEFDGKETRSNILYTCTYGLLTQTFIN